MGESRRYERVGFFCPVQLAVMPGGTAKPGQSLNLSLGGVSLITNCAFNVGQLVTVAFMLGDSVASQIEGSVIGRVVHFAADVDANIISIQFLAPLTEQSHAELVAQLLNV